MYLSEISNRFVNFVLRGGGGGTGMTLKLYNFITIWEACDPPLIQAWIRHWNPSIEYTVSEIGLVGRITRETDKTHVPINIYMDHQILVFELKSCGKWLI